LKNDFASFSRTMRALDADGMSPALLGVILVAGLAGVWTTWLVAARVPVYQLSAEARLEVDPTRPVASPVAVAEFGALSLGRLQPGQPGRLRLDGFPWTQYGYVDAVVTNVQTRDQIVRVELAVRRAVDSRIPILHGMPGVVEVEVERVAPLALLVQSLGHRLSGQTVVTTLQSEPARTP
jgi:hypothetical protein